MVQEVWIALWLRFDRLRENAPEAQKQVWIWRTARSVLIVTSDYHVPRSVALAEDLDLDATGIGSPCLSEYWIKNHSRETLAWVKYWLKKYLHLNL